MPLIIQVKKFIALRLILLLTVFSGLIYGLSFIVAPPRIFAIESPQQYFDYNSYYEPKVLGVSAQESSPSGEAPAPNYKDYKEFGGYFLRFTKDLAPDNPLYFLKRFEENVGLALTVGNPVRRAETLLAIGGERAGELDRMAAAGKTDNIKSLVASYDRTMEDQSKTLETLKGKLEATPLLLETDKEVAKHVLAFEEVGLKVPAQAVGHIETALAKAEEVVDRVADVAGRPAVPQDMIARLQAYKAQGLLSEEEVAKIVSSTNRRNARDEFRKLADNRVVPLADVKKFDEAAAVYYPQGFAKAIEMRKFKELSDLEKDRPDDATVQAVQEFAKHYKPGDVVPPAIRPWWAPMVRLEELQSTFRPDLLEAAVYFKYRPEEQQKYTELVERMKPTEKDMQYVRDIVAKNPSAGNDPAYARVLTIGDRFGTADKNQPSSPVAASCSSESHWVNVPFMPGGGYCVPDLVYQSISAGAVGGDSACPPGYHRAAAGGACYPDNPSGPGIMNYLPASGSCPSGYHWETDQKTGRGGYCTPDYITGGGGYPSPVTPPSYCPQGKIFREGKCEDYKPPPTDGCPKNSWWNGTKCVEQKDCGQGKYQDSNGECKSTAEEYKRYQSLCQDRPVPPGGCGSGYWDMASCSCVGGGGGSGFGSPSRDSQEATCRAGGGRCVSWVNGACGCERIKTNSGGSPSTGDGGASMEENCRRGGCTWVGRNNACECPSGGGSGSSPSRDSQEETCRAGGGRCASWVNGACGCERNTSGGPPASGGGSSGGPTYGGGSYNPEEMCRRGGNCRWENNSCQCGSSTASGGGSSGGPPSCGSGFYWNGSFCTRNESQNNPPPPPPSGGQPPSQPPPSNPSPPPASGPPPNNPPPAEQRPPENPQPPPPQNNPPPPPASGPPADNPPPAENPPPAQ